MESVDQFLQRLHGRRVYIDANVFIYHLSGMRQDVNFVSKSVLAACADHKLLGTTGDAAVSEVLYGAYKAGDMGVVARITSFFGIKEMVTVVGHDAQVFESAARIGGSTGMKLIDALHVATAIKAGCAALLTNDRGIRSIADLEIVQISTLIA